MKKIIVIFSIVALIIILYFQFNTKKEDQNIVLEENENYNSNLLENIIYVAKDDKGNEYIINAEKGEIDLENSDIIFLENVKSLIKLKNSDEINIVSSYGKYNVSNYDTIFSKNVVINYLDNQINGEYLDFSLRENRMIISRNVIFTNLENILSADVIEIDIKTKDTNIFMYEENKKVNIRNKKYPNGNN